MDYPRSTIQGASLGQISAKPPKQREDGMRCNASGCSTILSRFNRGSSCWAHQEMRPIPLVAPSKGPWVA